MRPPRYQSQKFPFRLYLAGGFLANILTSVLAYWLVSGMRATGLLHMGHMAGALSNWVRLQDDYECYYFIADWHALTSNYADSANTAGYC